MKALFYQEMAKRNILFPNVIYIQFSHTANDINLTLEAAQNSFEIVAQNLYNVDKALEGKRSVEIFRKNS